MKTLVYLLLISMSLFAISCKKKDSIDKNSLGGTTWTVETNNDNYITLKFLDGRNIDLSGRADGDKVTGTGSYTYTSPSISVTLDLEDDTFKGSGTVAGSKMTLTLKSVTYNVTETLIFTKE